MAGPVGTLLAALHATPVEASVLTVDELVGELVKKAAKLTAAHAPLGPTMSTLVGTTLRRRGEVSTRGDVTLHGDFHLDQLVGSATGPVLVDLDSMVLGPREVDLAEFLVDLRNTAPKAVKKFHDFVFEVVKKALLADGEISAAETAWLQKFILADGKVDDMEKAFLLDLKKSARKTSPEFEALLKKHAV